MKYDSNNASFVYSVNLLRMLLGMELITEDEYSFGFAVFLPGYWFPWQTSFF